jgi:hypothetical protein
VLDVDSLAILLFRGVSVRDKRAFEPLFLVLTFISGHSLLRTITQETMLLRANFHSLEKQNLWLIPPAPMQEV